jgi:hypothetical protein
MTTSTDTRPSVAVHPTLLALALAAISLPIVALTLNMTVEVETWVDLGHWSGWDEFLTVTLLPPGDPARWLAAAGSVFASALVAGTLLAPRARSHAKRGAWLTITVAWIAAIAALPVLPALAGRGVGVEPFAVLFSDYYLAMNTTDPFAAFRVMPGSGGLQPVVGFWLGPLYEPTPFLALVFGVTVWTILVRANDWSLTGLRRELSRLRATTWAFVILTGLTLIAATVMDLGRPAAMELRSVGSMTALGVWLLGLGAIAMLRFLIWFGPRLIPPDTGECPEGNLRCPECGRCVPNLPRCWKCGHDFEAGPDESGSQ